MVPSPQVEDNNSKMPCKRKCIMDYTKSLCVPNLKTGTLFIGYLNAAISILFVILSSVSLANWSPLFNVGSQDRWGNYYYDPATEFFNFLNDIGPPVILTIGLVCLGLTAALIVGTHKQKTKCMRMYFSFGIVGLGLTIMILGLGVFIMACYGRLTSMIFAMQMFFFLGVYVVELYVIQQTIELFELPPNTPQEVPVTDQKDQSLLPYYTLQYAPTLTTQTI